MTFSGFDVSAIQGKINFPAIKAAGASFIIQRCGIGNDSIDKNYAANINAAKSAGLLTACYHFVYPLPADPTKPLRDPIKQAQYHFNASLGEITFCDLEWPLPKDWAQWGCSASQIKTWAESYLAEYEKLSGRKPMIYTYPDFCTNVKFSSNFAQYGLWVASYENSPMIPAPWTNYVLWQKGQGPLPGTGVNTDIDECPDLSIFKIASPTPPVDVYSPPVPAPTPVDIYNTPSVPTPPPAPPIVPPAQPTPANSIWQVKVFIYLWNLLKSKLG